MTVVAAAASSASTPVKGLQPHPPLHARQRGGAPGAVGDKHFTVRDGFHLKTRNDEKRRVIDQQLLPQSEPASISEAKVDDATSGSFGRPLGESNAAAASGPSALEIPLAVHWKLSAKEKRAESRHQQSRSSNNNVEDELEIPNTDYATTASSSRFAERPTSSTAPLQAPPPYTSSCTPLEAKVIAARLEPSSDWLIYRQRANVTPKRRDQRIEEMVQRVLQTTPAPESTTDTTSSADHAPLVTVLTPSVKESELQPPTRPRQPSLSGSTYHQRVLAARQHAGRSDNSPRSLYPLGERAPITATERTLLASREETNRDVDRLLATLFQQQQQAAAGAGATSAKPSELALTKQTKLRFSTRRSVLREQTAAALKSRNLASRMDELRSLPQVLEQMVQKQRDKRQQRVESYGQNLVLKNKRQSCLNLLQRPPLTPVFPSSIEQKQQQAIRRKQVFDAKEEAAARGAVDRWQRRRQHRQEEARRTYNQCQWLLLTTLALSSANWLGRFQAWKLKRDALRRVVMARRIQTFWRERVARRRRFGPGYSSYFAGTGKHISSMYLRMPLVTEAIALLQRAMRNWLRRKKDQISVAAVEIIVTSWLEFQDVKFRRLILRFRKRVRDFQIMWRTWRAITDARIKLLLLVWAKLERKSKRRNGVNVKLVGIPESSTSALVHSLHSAPPMSPEKRQKHLEGMHRHLKNGGTIQAPLAIASAAGAAHQLLSPAATGSQLGKPPSSIAAIARALSPKSMRGDTISGRVKQNLEVRQQIGEDFQNAMQDFFATTSTSSNNRLAMSSDPHLHPSPSHSPVATSHSPTRFHERGGGRSKGGLQTSAPRASVSWKALADAVGTPTHAEKIPVQLKVSMLRQLLSEKRKAFQVTKDKKRCAHCFASSTGAVTATSPLVSTSSPSCSMEWRSRRQQMRRIEFRYNVLEEMVEYQRFEAENAVFLVLHHVSEAEMLHVMHRAQQLANAAAAVAPEDPERRGSSGSVPDSTLGEHSPFETTEDTVVGSESASQSAPSSSSSSWVRAARSSTVGRASTTSSSTANTLVLDDEE